MASCTLRASGLSWSFRVSLWYGYGWTVFCEWTSVCIRFGRLLGVSGDGCICLLQGKCGRCSYACLEMSRPMVTFTSILDQLLRKTDGDITPFLMIYKRLNYFLYDWAMSRVNVSSTRCSSLLWHNSSSSYHTVGTGQLAPWLRRVIHVCSL